MSVENFQRGVQQFQGAKAAKDKTELATSELARSLKAGQAMAEVYANSPEGQTTAGQLSAIGLAAGTYDPKEAIKALTGMGPDKMTYALNLKAIENPNLAGVASKALGVYSGLKFAAADAKERAKYIYAMKKKAQQSGGTGAVVPGSFSLEHIDTTVKTNLANKLKGTDFEDVLSDAQSENKPLSVIAAEIADGDANKMAIFTSAVKESVGSAMTQNLPFMRDPNNLISRDSAINEAANIYMFGKGDSAIKAINSETQKVEYKKINFLMNKQIADKLNISKAKKYGGEPEIVFTDTQKLFMKQEKKKVNNLTPEELAGSIISSEEKTGNAGSPFRIKIADDVKFGGFNPPKPIQDKIDIVENKISTFENKIKEKVESTKTNLINKVTPKGGFKSQGLPSNQVPGAGFPKFKSPTDAKKKISQMINNAESTGDKAGIVSDLKEILAYLDKGNSIA